MQRYSYLRQKSFYIVLFIFSLACLLWWVLHLVRLSNAESRLALRYIELQKMELQQRLLQRPYQGRLLHLENGLPIHVPVDSLPPLSDEFPELQVRVEKDLLVIEPKTGYLANRLQAFQKQRYMLLGQAMFFLLLLCTGFYLLFHALQKARALHEMQNQFLLGITHDLKTPLAAVQLVLDTLRRNDIPANERERFLQLASSDTQQLQEQVENILQVIRIESGASFLRERLDLADLIRKEAGLFSQRQANRFLIKISTHVACVVRGDAEWLGLVLRNVLDNAAKYSLPATTIHIRLSCKQQKVLLEIEDQGCGIRPEDLPHLGTRFFRSPAESGHRRGSGLGLYLCKQILILHRGRVELRAAPIKGTIVSIELPCITNES